MKFEMNKQTIIIAMLTAALALTSCHQAAQKKEVGQQADTTETITKADTLRLVIRDKELAEDASFVTAIIINPTKQDVNFGAEYTIECETDGAWQTVPFPKDFGFASVLTTVAAGDTTTIYGHLAQFRLTPGHYRLCKPIAGKTLSDDFFIRSGVKFPTEIYR
jgi:hypothetical protein